MDQIGGHVGQPANLAFSPTEFDFDVLPFDITGFFQALTKPYHDMCKRFGGCDVEKTNYRHRRTLCAHRERPRRCATKKCEKLAPSHSITSSAAVSRVVGTVRPSAFPLLRLITRSNLVGC